MTFIYNILFIYYKTFYIKIIEEMKVTEHDCPSRYNNNNNNNNNDNNNNNNNIIIIII